MTETTWKSLYLILHASFAPYKRDRFGRQMRHPLRLLAAMENSKPAEFFVPIHEVRRSATKQNEKQTTNQIKPKKSQHTCSWKELKNARSETPPFASFAWRRS